MRALVLFANGTEEVEALTPLDYLRRAGIDVTFIGLSGKKQMGSHGICVETDVCLDEFDVKTEFDMLVIPGGMPGTNNIEASIKAQSLIDRAVNEGKFLAAICAAPKIYGARGLLRGKRATCYPGFEKDLVGAVICGDKVVRDGKMITATGAGAANEFALELISALCGEDKALEIGRSVRFFI